MKRLDYTLAIEYDETQISEREMECAVEQEIGGLYNVPGVSYASAQEVEY